MTRPLLLIGAALLSLLFAAPAFAAARAWVSSTGNDSGTCPLAAPCRTFQYAHDHVDAGGEIDVKDAGGYGTISINKAISVVADGVLATIGVQAGGFGVTVINTSSTDVVLLRGLTINGSNTSAGGGFAVGTGRVTIDHCSVKGLSAGVQASGNVAAMITNNVLTGNGVGIYVISSPLYVGIGGNVIANNASGIENFSSNNSAFSYGDNKINGNMSHDFYPAALPVVNTR